MNSIGVNSSENFTKLECAEHLFLVLMHFYVSQAFQCRLEIGISICSCERSVALLEVRASTISFRTAV